MAQSLATYISLPGTTGEALQHWQEILGGDLHVQRYGDMPPMPGMPFTPDPNAVAHGTLVLPGGAGVIAGGDSMDFDAEYPVEGTAYSLLLTTDTPEEARTILASFVNGGGRMGMQFERAPWGDWCGQVFDRYGVMWALSCEAAR